MTIVETLRAAGCVFAEDEAELILETASGPDEVARMVAQRVSGDPLEVVLGWASLGGIRFAVGPGVFIPRRRSELLVELGRAQPRGVVLDLCCGVGAVGAAIGGTELHASDIDPTAVAYAKRNVEGTVYEGDLYAPLPEALRGRVDILVFVAPYVPTDEIDLLPREARLYEPHATLDGGDDGLEIVRRTVAGAGEWLSPSGILLTEVSELQAGTVVELVETHGLHGSIHYSDDYYATVVTATRR